MSSFRMCKYAQLGVYTHSPINSIVQNWDGQSKYHSKSLRLKNIKKTKVLNSPTIWRAIWLQTIVADPILGLDWGCSPTTMKAKAADPRRPDWLPLTQFSLVFMSLLFVAGRDSLRSVECARFKISKVAVSTFKIFLAFSRSVPYSSLSSLISAGILILLWHLGPKNMSQTMFLYSFNFISTAHSALVKLIYFTNVQVNLIASCGTSFLLCCHLLIMGETKMHRV